jgi:hypothetical protein
LRRRSSCSFRCALEAKKRLGLVCTAIAATGLPRGRLHAAEHRLLDAVGDHVADVAEVLADLVDLEAARMRNSRSPFEVARGLPRGSSRSKPRPTKWKMHPLGALAVAVDAAVALLHPVGFHGIS